jgi:hypothetical protein
MHNMGINRLKLNLVISSILLLPSAATVSQETQDSVTGMCINANKSQEICDCATVAVRQQIGDAAFVIYERVGTVYLAGMAKGQGRSDAWMEAIASQNLELKTSNGYGKAHRDAITGCEP